MSECVGLLECTPDCFCDKHAREELEFWQTYFCPDSPAVAAARQQQMEIIAQLETASGEASAPLVDISEERLREVKSIKSLIPTRAEGAPCV